MSHLVLCTKGVHTTRQLRLLRLFGNTGLSNYIHAKVHRIKFYKQD